MIKELVCIKGPSCAWHTVEAQLMVNIITGYLSSTLMSPRDPQNSASQHLQQLTADLEMRLLSQYLIKLTEFPNSQKCPLMVTHLFHHSFEVRTKCLKRVGLIHRILFTLSGKGSFQKRSLLALGLIEIMQQMFDLKLFIFRHFSLSIQYLLLIQWPNKAASSQLKKAPVRNKIHNHIARSLSQDTSCRPIESRDCDFLCLATPQLTHRSP